MKHNIFSANGALTTPPCNSHKFSRLLRGFADGEPTAKATVKHTLRYAFLILTLILLTPSNAWGDNITFQGNETFYFDKASNSGWGHLDAPDADVYLEFANSGNNKTKSSPAQWEKQDDILKVTVPAGTYNQVHIVRGPKGNPGSVWNEFDWITLQTGKNQILNGGSWSTYTPVPCDNPKPAKDMYMAGQGFPNISWDVNSITMKWDCDLGVYYYTFTNLAADNTKKYRFKLNPSTDTSWNSQLNADNSLQNDHSGANLALKSDNEDKRITFDLAQNSDVTIYTDGSKVWAAQITPAEPLSSSDYYLRGDLWQNSSGNGWTDNTSKTPKFTKNGANTEATVWYVMPSGLSNGRFEFYEGSTVKGISDFWGSSTGLSNQSTKDNKIIFDCPSSPKLLSFTYTKANKLVVTATDPQLKSGFKAKYRKSGTSDWLEVSLDANGEAMLSNLDDGGKYYLIITDGGAIHGINWYGGLYFDMNNSNVAFDNKTAYYSSVSTGNNYPISSIAEPNGVFNITGGNTDVKVKFDGGKITINKATAPAPVEKSLQPWSGDTYKDWYLTGDFTCTQKNHFDGWTNPTDKKFVLSQDGLHQTVTIQLDPATDDETKIHNNNGHYLTRFEITKGDWNGDRINKPQFDSEGSNCSLQTDWKDPGSNRMTFELTQKSDITFDIWRLGTSPSNAERKVTVTITPVEQVTVTFMANDQQFAQQTIDKGGKATKPATDPTKAGYNFTGWDWDFNTTINENTFIHPKEWELKGVESVTLDNPTLKLLENGATATLTPTILPSDVLSTTTTWSSDNENVATVNNGVVTPHAIGKATITCTVANSAGTKSATCTVNVVDCELVPTAIFNGVGEIANPFDPSGQTEPAMITTAKLQIGDDGTGPYFAYDDNGTLRANTTGETWILEEAKKDGNIQIYYIHNADGKYIYLDDSKQMSANGGWPTYQAKTSNSKSENNANYMWFEAEGNWSDARHILSYKNGAANPAKDDKYYTLHRRHWSETWLWNNQSANGAVACGTQITAGGNNFKDLRSKFYDKKDAPNPNYKTATVTKDKITYYRFAANGTMTCTLSDKVLKVGDKISVYCYNTASSTVSGELRIGGSKVADISLSNAGAETYEYTVTDDSKGATQIVVATSNADFCVAGVKVERELPIGGGKPAGLTWTTAPADPVVATVGEGDITYTATATSAGDITYSSSAPAVATVNATTGVVTPMAAGTTVITATIEQDGCYAGGSISYNLQLTDLPKPEITFVTVPTEMPQGLANQTIVVTTTGGNNFNLAITEGEGATLNITENTGTQITATLSMGADATNIELTASTECTATLAQNAVTVNVAVSACIPEGANIFEFTLTSSAAATGQTADGVIGGTVDQTALGTKGTEDNPATVDAIKIKMKDNKYVYDNNGKVEVKDNEGGSECQWAMIPTGETYKPSWSGNTYTLYYLKNVSTNKYMKRGAGRYGSNGDWYYYTTVTDATLGNGDEYKWFKATDNGIGIINRADIGSSIDQSYHLHIANQYNSTTDEYAQKPAVPCGITKNNFNDYSKVTLTTSSVANPDMLKYVKYNNKDYYIISSLGAITLHGDFKAGDTVKVDTYNRQTKEVAIEKYEIQANADSYTYRTSNEYVCVNNIKVWRDQVGKMVDPTLTFAQSEVTLDVQQSQATYTQVATPSVTTISNITYQSSNTEVATVDANGLVELVNPENIKHRTSITITATMPAVGCYNEATASYTILVMNLTPTALQTLVDDTEEGGTLTLQDDFDNCNVTISKAIKIDAQGHKIGNLTITTAGDLTLASAMTVEDFCIASDQSEQHSGQMKNPANLTLRGNAYIDITFAPVEVNTGWYAFTVPFTVSATAGVYNGNTKMKNEYDYAIMEYQGDVRAQGKYGWIKSAKVGGKLQAGHFYVITLGDTEYKTMRFMMTKGSTLAASTSMNIYAYSSDNSGDAGWNGVGNPNLYHATAAIDGITKMQTYNHTNDAFEVGTLNDSHVVGTPYFVQTNGDKTMTTYVVAEKANAPARMLATATAEEEFIVDLESDGKKQDRIFLSASDEASATYEIGHDLTKMTLGNAKVAQIAINGYNMELCDAEFVLDNNEAVFPLTITTPQAGEYTLSIKRACEGQTITLLQNGLPIVMTDGQVSIDLAKGTTTEYSLVIGRTKTDVVTGNEQLKANGEGVQKIILHNALRIIKNGKMYNVLGL